MENFENAKKQRTVLSWRNYASKINSVQTKGNFIWSLRVINEWAAVFPPHYIRLGLLYVHFTSFFFVKTSSVFWSNSVDISLWKISSNLCLRTSEMVAPPFENFWRGVMTLSIRPRLPMSRIRSPFGPFSSLVTGLSTSLPAGRARGPMWTLSLEFIRLRYISWWCLRNKTLLKFKNFEKKLWDLSAEHVLCICTYRLISSFHLSFINKIRFGE